MAAGHRDRIVPSRRSTARPRVVRTRWLAGSLRRSPDTRVPSVQPALCLFRDDGPQGVRTPAHVARDGTEMAAGADYHRRLNLIVDDPPVGTPPYRGDGRSSEHAHACAAEQEIVELATPN